MSNNGQANPSRQEQEHQARQSPLKTPETETANAKPSEVDAAAAVHQHGPRPSKDAAETHRDNGEHGGPSAERAGETEDRSTRAGHSSSARSDTPASFGAPGASGANQSAEQKQREQLPEDVSARGMDVDNDYSADSTLDTDGKDHDTKRVGRMADSEVLTNATEDNAIPTSPVGIAGIDSRPDGNRPGILLGKDSHMVDEGFGVDHPVPGDNNDDPTMTPRRREHQAANHTRPAHLIRIEKT